MHSDRVREVHAEIMLHLGKHAPSPSTDVKMPENKDGGISMLTPTDAYALGTGVVVRLHFNEDGSRLVGTYRNGNLIGKVVTLSKPPDTGEARRRPRARRSCGSLTSTDRSACRNQWQARYGCCFIEDLWVQSETRNQGIGRALMRAAESHCLIQDSSKVGLNVGLDGVIKLPSTSTTPQATS